MADLWVEPREDGWYGEATTDRTNRYVEGVGPCVEPEECFAQVEGLIRAMWEMLPSDTPTHLASMEEDEEGLDKTAALRGRGRGRGRRRRRQELRKKKRFVREMWRLRKGGNVAYLPGVDVGDDSLVVYLRPGAKVLDVPDSALRKTAQVVDGPDAALLAAVREQAEAIKNMTVMLDRLVPANKSAYDAIRSGERLVVLNADALEAEGAKRDHWSRTRALGAGGVA